MAASPFDIKTVLLAKHAQHVVVIHFPIALCIAGVVFDVLGRWFKKQPLLAAAYYNLMGAALFTLPAVITGILAWRWALEGQQLAGLLLLHLLAGSLSKRASVGRRDPAFQVAAEAGGHARELQPGARRVRGGHGDRHGAPRRLSERREWQLGEPLEGETGFGC